MSGIYLFRGLSPCQKSSLEVCPLSEICSSEVCPLSESVVQRSVPLSEICCSEVCPPCSETYYSEVCPPCRKPIIQRSVPLVGNLLFRGLSPLSEIYLFGGLPLVRNLLFRGLSPLSETYLFGGLSPLSGICCSEVCPPCQESVVQRSVPLVGNLSVRRSVSLSGICCSEVCPPCQESIGRGLSPRCYTNRCSFAAL
ncbi:hypothetical protein PilKf_02130 [Pillotina sp. SPG140]